MPLDINQAIFRLFIGAVVGAIVGLEREKTKEINKEKSPIGIRTDILAGLLGGIAVYLSQLISPWIFLITLLAIITIGLLPIVQNHSQEKLVSYKTSISFIIVFLLGGLAFYGEIQVALAVAIITTFVLSLKYTLHRFIYGLDYNEIIDAIKFVIIAFIILPFLPNQAYDQTLLSYIEPAAQIQQVEYAAPSTPVIGENTASTPIDTRKIQTNIINPYRIWMLIVIISGLNFLGYIFVKIYGRDKAYSLTGLVGGFYSSTVTSLNLATTSKSHPDLTYPFVAGILLACGSSFFKMFVLIRTLNAELFDRLFPSLLAMCVYLLLSGGFFHVLAQKRKLQQKGRMKEQQLMVLKSPLNLKSAFKLAIFVICTMLAANLILRYADISVYYVLAGFMAFLSVDDPIIISTADIAGTAISLDIAKSIILGVIFLNFLQKLATAYFFGNRKLVKPLAVGLGGLFLVTLGSLLYL